jgi:hypothetical protein
MIRFHKSAQDGWLQKQFFLQRSFAAAPVDQIYLCGEVAIAVSAGDIPLWQSQVSRSGRQVFVTK